MHSVSHNSHAFWSDLCLQVIHIFKTVMFIFRAHFLFPMYFDKLSTKAAKNIVTFYVEFCGYCNKIIVSVQICDFGLARLEEPNQSAVMTQEVRLGPIFSKSGGKRQNVSPSLAFSSHLQILRKYCTMHYPNLAFVHSRCYLLLIISLPPCSANKS